MVMLARLYLSDDLIEEDLRQTFELSRKQKWLVQKRVKSFLRIASNLDGVPGKIGQRHFVSTKNWELTIPIIQGDR